MKPTQLTTLLAATLLLTGCSTLKKGAEFEFQKDVQEILTDEFQARLIQALKTEDAATIIRAQSLRVLDEQIPPDDRSTLHLIMKYFGESLAAISLAVVVYLRRKLGEEKKITKAYHAKVLSHTDGPPGSGPAS
jgi:hypothetical protein